MQAPASLGEGPKWLDMACSRCSQCSYGSNARPKGLTDQQQTLPDHDVSKPRLAVSMLAACTPFVAAWVRDMHGHTSESRIHEKADSCMAFWRWQAIRSTSDTFCSLLMDHLSRLLLQTSQSLVCRYKNWIQQDS